MLLQILSFIISSVFADAQMLSAFDSKISGKPLIVRYYKYKMVKVPDGERTICDIKTTYEQYNLDVKAPLEDPYTYTEKNIRRDETYCVKRTILDHTFTPFNIRKVPAFKEKLEVTELQRNEIVPQIQSEKIKQQIADLKKNTKKLGRDIKKIELAFLDISEIPAPAILPDLILPEVGTHRLSFRFKAEMIKEVECH